MLKSIYTLCIFFLLHIDFAYGQKITIDRNTPERKEWFSDMGFGMFINWSIDVQLGATISHNLAVGSKDYQEHYFRELPKTFNPENFNPEEWAKLAKLAGMKYMIFTAKHHNGFCMWDTKTSKFNILNSGYEKDILKEIIDAFRKYDIAIGLYFSPDDFYNMYQQGYPPSRESPESESTRNSALWEINKNQLQELLTGYGKIDILYIDEKSDWANLLVANYVWDMDPNIVITRGGMNTYEHKLPESSSNEPWEVSTTMGYHWQYVAGEKYKSAETLINLLIETRAKGGNLLLNVGPDSYGEIPEPQGSRLREIGLWQMANHEAIENVRPWKITNENDSWFTQSKDGASLYAFVNSPYWKWMEERAFFIRSLTGGPDTKISILGQNDEMMEYMVNRSPKPLFSMVKEGIFVNVVKAQRLKKNWNNPLVIKFEGVAYKKANK